MVQELVILVTISGLSTMLALMSLSQSIIDQLMTIAQTVEKWWSIGILIISCSEVSTKLVILIWRLLNSNDFAIKIGLCHQRFFVSILKINNFASVSKSNWFLEMKRKNGELIKTNRRELFGPFLVIELTSRPKWFNRWFDYTVVYRLLNFGAAFTPTIENYYTYLNLRIPPRMTYDLNTLSWRT